MAIILEKENVQVLILPELTCEDCADFVNQRSSLWSYQAEHNITIVI